jgi:hypothetical protein
MSLFSIYTGVLYNETFSMAFDWFGSNYYYDVDKGAVVRNGGVYPLGLDPIWKMVCGSLFTQEQEIIDLLLLLSLGGDPHSHKLQNSKFKISS